MNHLEKITDYNNLYNAYRAAKMCKTWKRSINTFGNDVNVELVKVRDELLNKTYNVGLYNKFKIFEPKPRDIMSNSFKDKIVQHSVCDNVLIELLSPSFIYDNYASQKGKGTDFARNRLKEHLHRYYRKNKTNSGYILKCDISKYFYNIDHDILKEQLKPFFKDGDSIWWLIEQIIDSTPNPGLPIGNQTSQYFSVLYLSPMDHYIKEHLHIKYYGRYVDDFFLIHESKEYLEYCLEEIRRILPKVELNKKTQICKLENGIEFLGFKYYLTKTGKVITKLAASKKQRYRKKIKKTCMFNNFEQSYQCMKAHVSKGDTYYLLQTFDKYVNKMQKKLSTTTCVDKNMNITMTKGKSIKFPLYINMGNENNPIRYNFKRKEIIFSSYSTNIKDIWVDRKIFDYSNIPSGKYETVYIHGKWWDIDIASIGAKYITASPSLQDGDIVNFNIIDKNNDEVYIDLFNDKNELIFTKTFNSKDLWIGKYLSEVCTGDIKIEINPWDKLLDGSLIYDLPCGNYKYKLRAKLIDGYITRLEDNFRYIERDLTNMLRFQIIGE